MRTIRQMSGPPRAGWAPGLGRTLGTLAAVATIATALTFGAPPWSAHAGPAAPAAPTPPEVRVDVPPAAEKPAPPPGPGPIVRPPAPPAPAPAPAGRGGARTVIPARPAPPPAVPAVAPAAPDAGAACTPKEPAIPDKPATSGSPAKLDKAVYLVGDRVVVTAEGYGAAEQVQLAMFSEGTAIGNFAADADGSVRASFEVPAETKTGTHVLQFTGWCAGVATAELLIGSPGAAAATGGPLIPMWTWWAGGFLLLVLAGIAAWRVLRALSEDPGRRPALPEGAAA